MKLSKDQIKYIDDYLIEYGVKYWDVRIELIDHIASKLEENKKLVLNKTFLIKEFGTSISLSKVIDEKTTILIKKYRNLVFKEFKSFFKSPIKTLGLFVFIGLYYLIFLKLSTKFFIQTSFALFYLPLLVYLFFSIYNSIKKNKSVHIKSAIHFFLLGVIFINPFLMGVKSDASFNQKLTLFILLSLHTMWVHCGFKIYYKTHKKYNKIYKQLKTV